MLALTSCKNIPTMQIVFQQRLNTDPPENNPIASEKLLINVHYQIMEPPQYVIMDKAVKPTYNPQIEVHHPAPKILLVEDNPMIQRINAHLLTLLGCEVDVATNGKEALAMAKKSYDLIFLDIDLPDISGIVVAEILRRVRENYRVIPIIALTAMDESIREECLRAGINEVVAKPILMEGLREILERHLKYRLQ